MSCKAKKRTDIKERGKSSIEFVFNNIPRYFCYGYIDLRTDELIDECKECPENVNKADEVMQKLKRGEKVAYDGKRNRNRRICENRMWNCKNKRNINKK